VNSLEKVFANLKIALGQGLKRQPQEFIYLDRTALYEHYKALTGMNRVPAGISESIGASAGAGILGLSIDGSANTSTSFDISEPHLFESLEPMLREKYPEVADETAVTTQLRSFGWFSGALNYMRVGPITVQDTVIEEARTFYTLEAAGLPFCLACNAKSFSPFVPFLMTEPYLYKFQIEVKILAYNPGVLDRFALEAHPKAGCSLVLVPTVILSKDKRTNDEIADWLKKLNEGKISRRF